MIKEQNVQIPPDVLLLGCTIKSISSSSIEFLVENFCCACEFNVSFFKNGKIKFVKGNLIDLQRFKDAKLVALQIFNLL